ncbi:hypothetical protein F4167_21685 [Candidatus Poribacteria bacterium]|nr:hypothetical protein [Candidatus Poribacteria bacterium]
MTVLDSVCILKRRGSHPEIRDNMGRYITFLFLFCFCINGNADTQVLIDTVIAVVNTDAITRSELENEFRIAAIMEKPLVEGPTAVEKRAVLQTIINRKFVLQESERIGIVVAEHDVRIADRIAEIRAGYASEAEFQSVLQQFQLEIESLEAWVYEQLIYDEFFRRKFFNAVNSAEVEKLAKSYYDTHSTEFVVPPTVTFNSLLIVIPEGISETEKQNVVDLIQELNGHLQQRKPFEAVRKAYETLLTLKFAISTVEADTPLGGIITELKISERSQPIGVAEGYQIVERIRHNPAYQKTYSEVSEEITERIRQEEAAQRFKAWLTRQKEEKTWHILDDELTRTENNGK